ncbi:short-chain dehydrogenase/reductase [Apiospora marii]|uniref:short-chain dehydrogenase/reductase n=1 Tax=Apiospora marii TaxID=335849 RepID=UPI00313198C5
MNGPPGGSPGQQPPPPPQKTTVLLTGCSDGGIGFALAQEYHRRGCRVIATARSPAKMAKLKALGGGTDDDLILLQLDVTDPASIRAAVQAVTDLTKDNSSLDILVNNAGNGYQSSLLDADLDESRRLFDVNVWGLLAMTQAFAPLLVASAAAGRRPRVVNIGSVVGVVPVPWQGIYNASKHAVAGLNDAMRLEFRPLGIDVVHVVTGGIKTNFYDNSVGTDALPPNSIYAPIGAEIEASVDRGRATEMQGTPVDAYARTVVAQTLKSSPPISVWKGSMSTLVWLAERLGWEWGNDRLIEYLWGMFSLPSKFQAATSKKQL